MGILNIFSKRKKKNELSGKVDVFSYDKIPAKFRIQVIQIWEDAIGPFRAYTAFDVVEKVENNEVWISIFKSLAKELGVFSLGSDNANPKEQCIEFIQQASTDNVLDIIEVSFGEIFTRLGKMSDYNLKQRGVTQQPNDAISDLNARFFENGLGYQFQNGEIVRVDSQFLHEEVVKSALTLIHKEGFRGAEDEFRKAHEHYRHGRQKEALNEALKAFESTAKSICDVNKWKYPPQVTAKGLLDIMFEKEIISSELQAHFAALRSMLESGVPAVRNKQGGHGQGLMVKEVPGHLVGFILHSTASAIVLMVQSHLNKN